MNWCHDSNGLLFSFIIRILHNEGPAPTLGPIPHAHVGDLPQANNSNNTAFTHELSNFESNLLIKYVQYALYNAYTTWNRQKIHFSMCERKKYDFLKISEAGRAAPVSPTSLSASNIINYYRKLSITSSSVLWGVSSLFP